MDIVPGEAFEVVGDAPVELLSYLRLCSSWEDEKNLVEGVRRLARGVRGALEGSGNSEK